MVAAGGIEARTGVLRASRGADGPAADRQQRDGRRKNRTQKTFHGFFPDLFQIIANPE